MASRGESKKAKLASLLKERSIECIDEAAWAEIATALSPVSSSYLRGLLRDSGVRLSPTVEGVNQSSFEDLERTLIALAGEYERADALSRMSLRNAVITAKDHARFAVQRAADPEKKQMKEEMLLWMRTWLENPVLFPSWVGIRRNAVDSSGTGGAHR